MVKHNKSHRSVGYVEGRPNVVVVGGGFGGVNCVRALRRSNANVILVDRMNHTLFQPLLYQLATGVLDDSSIAWPLRQVFARQANVSVLRASVDGFDVERRCVLAGELEIPWDHLVLAAGMTTSYFGNDQWASIAPGLKTLDDAHTVRGRILEAFEQAEYVRVWGEVEEVRPWLTFVVVGGGATGVEVAGAIKQLAVDRLAPEFKDLDVAGCRVLLVEGGDRLLASMSAKSSAGAARTLKSYGVEIRLDTRVVDVTSEGVTVTQGETKEFIPARTVVWGAGVTGSSLGALLGEAVGLETDRGGRLKVAGDLTVSDRDDVRVIGDIARVETDDQGGTVPGIAQGAIQMGTYAGKAIAARIAGRAPSKKPFKYFDKGSLATIGRGKAVLDMGRLHRAGFAGWLVWAVVHITFLVNFRSRVAAMGAWAFAYVFQTGVNELITKAAHAEDHAPKDTTPAASSDG